MIEREKTPPTAEEKCSMMTVDIIEGFDLTELFGNLDVNLDIIKENTAVDVFQRNSKLILKGPSEKNLKVAAEIIEELSQILLRGEKLDTQKVTYIAGMKKKDLSFKTSSLNKDIICFTTNGRPLKPKTAGQKKYVDAMRKKDIVFGIGPAGTGKTYIAVAMAVNAYRNKEVQKIILARPAVEAGESLGFLPGDLQEKVDPYLRPLYDALYDIMGRDNALRLKEKEDIEVVPLAYMRGRTLDNAFIILDEAQNSTPEQMKMFLTRMGFGSQVVVTGDVTQIDLPSGKKSGLKEAEQILKNIDDIGFCYLTDVDVVRHSLVKKIINAYDNYYSRKASHQEKKGEEKKAGK